MTTVIVVTGSHYSGLYYVITGSLLVLAAACGGATIFGVALGLYDKKWLVFVLGVVGIVLCTAGLVGTEFWIGQW